MITFGAARLQQRPRIVGAVGGINAVMQMRRRTARIAGIANKADQTARFQAVEAGNARCEAIHVGVVVAFAARTYHPHMFSADAEIVDVADQSSRGAANRRATFGENVDTLMTATTAACGAPCVSDARRQNAVNRYR